MKRSLAISHLGLGGPRVAPIPKLVPISSLNPHNLLPDASVLKLAKGLEVSKYYEITNHLIKNFTTTSPDQIIALGSGNYAGLGLLGIMLSRHAPQGEPLGAKVLAAVSPYNPNAAFRYAQMLTTGWYNDQIPDQPRALKILRDLAGAKDHTVSQYALGSYLLINPGLGDLDEGLGYLVKAAEKSFLPACMQLGHMFAKGIHVPRDRVKAFAFLKTAADADQPEAMFLLSDFYTTGDGLLPPAIPDPKTGFEYLLKAANGGLKHSTPYSGLAIAQHNVGVEYFPRTIHEQSKSANNSAHNTDTPFTVEADIWKAIEYWKMAAHQSLHLSCINLGKLYLEGWPSSAIQGASVAPRRIIVPKDLHYARQCFQRVIDVNDPALVDEARQFMELVHREEARL